MHSASEAGSNSAESPKSVIVCKMPSEPPLTLP
jgi:hypothetical protein